MNFNCCINPLIYSKIHVKIYKTATKCFRKYRIPSPRATEPARSLQQPSRPQIICTTGPVFNEGGADIIKDKYQSSKLEPRTLTGLEMQNNLMQSDKNQNSKLLCISTPPNEDELSNGIDKRDETNVFPDVADVTVIKQEGGITISADALEMKFGETRVNKKRISELDGQRNPRFEIRETEF